MEMFAKLNTGATIPILGFGTYSETPASPEEAKAVIWAAIQAGYRHFDTASFYNSERPLGEALSEAFQAGLVRREDVFITSKLWCSDNHHDDVLPAIQKTLSALQLEYLDLYLIHWPIRLKKGAPFFTTLVESDFPPLDTKGTWKAMEKCVEQGLTKAIGLSNFSIKKIEDLLTYASIPPAVNQVEMHPKWQQKKLREYCNAVNIHVSAYSPMGASGSSWGSPDVLDHPVVKDIALKHNKSPAQVVLRWGVEQGVSVLPKSNNNQRLLENTQIFNWKLTHEDHEKLIGIEQRKVLIAEWLCNATTSPYKNVQELWDEEL